MAAYTPRSALALMPYAQEDDRLFGRLLKVGLVLFVIVSIVLPLVSVPSKNREEKQKLPPQLARVILAKEKIKPPPKPKPKPKTPEEKPKPKPKPEKKSEPKPKPRKKPQPDELQKARDKAKVSGVLQFKDALADMRDEIDTQAVASQDITRGQAKAKKTERNLITSGATADSGGIDTAKLSRDTGGVALSGRETTQVKNPEGGNNAQASHRRVQTAAARERSGEEIRKAMERHISAIYAIYHRALRKNPALQGKMVLKLVIKPNGMLKDVSIVSSDLKDANLEQKVVARVKLITFKPRKNVLLTTRNYTLNFLPQL